MSEPGRSTARDVEVEIDSSVPHPARIYDYLLGGTVNFAVDREAAEYSTAAMPGGSDTARAIVRANRDFLGRAVRYLASDAGVRQFLDIGTGIPNADNVHAVAHQAAPDARVVYVDNDPIVLAHAHTLLAAAADSATTTYVHGDLHDPGDILDKAAATLDFARPVAIVVVGVLHFFRDDEDPWGMVARLVDAAVPGSYLAISHLASDIEPEMMAALAERYDDTVPEPMVVRSRDEVARFFDGLEMVEPGLVPINEWPEAQAMPGPAAGWTLPVHGGIGRKP
jgi:SAM-dependent methyltransferase